MAATMHITVRYFGMIAEAVGTSQETLPFHDHMTLQALREKLLQQYAWLAQHTFSVSVNRKIVSNDVLLQENDEIALLPPFAGG